MTTAGQPNSPWLFPGQAPGQHLGAKQLTARLVRVGVRSPSRQAALNTLVTEIPAPLLAEALGYHPKTVTLRPGELGTDWANYQRQSALLTVPGMNTRRSNMPKPGCLPSRPTQ